MKTKILTFLLFCLLGSFNLIAGNDEVNFKQTVISKITYPDFAKAEKLEADVYVSFTVNKNGEITVNQANALYPDFMDYVKTELKKIKVNTENEVIGKTYFYKFTFKYQE